MSVVAPRRNNLIHADLCAMSRSFCSKVLILRGFEVGDGDGQAIGKIWGAFFCVATPVQYPSSK